MTEQLLDYFNGDELAAGVWQSKYASEGEKTPDEMHKRMAKEFAKIEEKYFDIENAHGYVTKKTDLSNYGQIRERLTEEKIYNLFKDFKYIVPQGSIMATLGTNSIASLSNCWVAESPLDSYGGILKTDGDLAYYYKRRGGVGTDISNLRPKNTKTNNTSNTSTGAVSFMHRYSNTTREVAMNGRRGALMLSIDVNHPDVLDFIKVKRDGTSVTGANVSVRLNKNFMESVRKDEDYVLRFPCDSSTPSKELKNTLEYDELTTIDGISYKKIKAKKYWDELIFSAKNHAEPGLLYWDNALDYDPAAVYEEFKPVCTNPCGEQFLNANDSCRLMVLVLLNMVDNPFTKNAKINKKRLYEMAYEFARLGDNLVDLELEYIQRIIDKIKSDPEPERVKRDELELWQTSYDRTKAGRRVGLGITGLGDMLAALNLSYDSDKGMETIEEVMSIKMQAELDCTIDLAIVRGTFDGWDVNLENPSYKTNKDAVEYGNSFYYFLRSNFTEQFHKMCRVGRRNVSWSTIAPTGSVSLLTQTTSGCEPLFMPFYMRRKKINPSEEGIRVDFVDEIGDSWQEFPVMHERFVQWAFNNHGIPKRKLELFTKEELDELFKESPWYKSTANDIDWIKRNKIQSILQRYTTNAISSTINLPSTVTEKEISNIYMSGWEMGLKGQTVYVDGSRSGVLVDNNSEKDDVFEYHDAPKRPRELKAEVNTLTALGERYSVVVGLMDSKPYEVFVEQGDEIIIKSGKIVKKRKGVYVIEGNVKDSNVTQTLNLHLSDEELALTRMISTALRHGANIKFIVEQLNKADGTIVSFSKAIARTLKKYIPDGEKATVSCQDCGSDNVVFEEGCHKCLDCGSSKCG